MKKLSLQVLLLASLAVLPLLANAAHDERRGDGWSGGNGLEWRLGSGRGWGNDIYFRQAGDRHWRRAPGSARELGDGWVIGTDRHRGGYGIYRWNGYGWQRMPGAAVSIGGSFNSPWVVNDRGERFSWSGYDWREDRNYRRGNGRGDRDWDDRRDDRREDHRDDRGDDNRGQDRDRGDRSRDRDR